MHFHYLPEEMSDNSAINFRKIHKRRQFPPVRWHTQKTALPFLSDQVLSFPRHSSVLPLLFYLLIFEPKAEQIKNAAVITALSFATFENVCYLIQNGAGHFSFIFFRGIGTGAMHVICGAIVGGGLAYVWQRTWLKIAGTCGLLGAAITFHAIYNLLIAYGGAAQYIAYLLPVLILAAGKLIFRSSIQ